MTAWTRSRSPSFIRIRLTCVLTVDSSITNVTGTAVVHGIGRTGQLVTSAALIMFLSFVAMASAPSTQAKMIATGLGAGIILDATVVRALLVPAAVALFGRFNWWLPQRVARVLRVSPSHPPAPNPSRA